MERREKASAECLRLRPPDLVDHIRAHGEAEIERLAGMNSIGHIGRPESMIIANTTKSTRTLVAKVLL